MSALFVFVHLVSPKVHLDISPKDAKGHTVSLLPICFAARRCTGWALAMSHRTKNPALQGVQWRFLSSDVASGALVQNESEFDQPMTDEAQRRIAYLEQALASTQDLDAQSMYQSFLMEAGKHAPGGSSARGPVSPRASELVDGVDLLAVDGEAGGLDQIPGDPFDAQPLYLPGARSRGTERRGPPSMRFEGGGATGGGAAGAGSYSAEDDEVARVQAHAATGESEAAVEPERNSPSPVIIWRHAAPVKLANNVPADLLPRAPPPASSSTGRRRGSPQRGSPLSPAGGGASSYGGEEAVGAPRADRRQLQHDYANSRAWYLPVSTWTTNGEGARGRDGGGGDGGEGGAKGSKELLPKLYSSRIYKEYLNAQNVQRIPHYLAHVEPPKPPPKAGRGNTSPARRGSESPEGSS